MYIKDGKSPLEGQWDFYQTPSFVLETSPACFYFPQKLSFSNLVASILREVSSFLFFLFFILLPVELSASWLVSFTSISAFFGDVLLDQT